MKVTEIRIGNIHGAPGRPVLIDESDFMNMYINDLDYPDMKLTDDWLKELGFSKRFDNTECNIWEPPTADKSTPYMAIAHVDDKFIELMSRAKILYVHQLQNLYYAITGKELTFNPKILGE